MGCNTSSSVVGVGSDFRGREDDGSQRPQQAEEKEEEEEAPADLSGPPSSQLMQLSQRLEKWTKRLAKAAKESEAKKTIEDCKAVATLLSEDKELASSEEAKEVLVRVCQALASVWQASQEEDGTSLVTRVCGGTGWAVHGLCFELKDGRRLGRFLENNGSDMDLPNELGLLGRGGKWHGLAKGEHIIRVSGYNCRNGYLCYAVTLYTNMRQAIEISAQHKEWQGSSFNYTAPKGEQIINVYLNNGTCKGIQTQATPNNLSHDQRRQLAALMLAPQVDEMWEPLVKVALQDGIGSQAKYLFHLACSMKKHTLPCFQQFSHSISQFHNSPSYWDNSILESIKIDEGHRITTDDGKVLFSERKLSDQELALMQKLVDSSFVRRYTRDRRGESVPDSLKLVSGYHIQNLNCWKDFATRNQEIQDSLKADEKAAAGGYQVENLRTRGVLGEDERFTLDATTNTEWLWHGTTVHAAKSIVRGDFRLDKAGSNAGTLFGKGLYFAESCSKSDEYSTEDSEGNRCLLLCRVTLGKVNYCDEEWPSSAQLMSSCLRGGYHSILGDREKVHRTFREFIVYDDDQAYAEYMLFYKRTYA